MVASACRLNWTVCDEAHLITDIGESLDLKADPPAVVKKKVKESVKRWRWRNVALKHNHLNGNEQGVLFDPVVKILHTKKLENHTIEMTRNIQAGLRSALANRQWTQVRCYKAGFTKHDKCWLCAAQHFKRTNGNEQVTDEQVLLWLEFEAPAELDIPIGTWEHRIWFCPALDEERQRHGSACMTAYARGELEMDIRFKRAHTTGLFPQWRHPSFRIQQLPPQGTFDWIIRPSDGTAKAKFYTDGSRFDEKRGDMVRFG